ncbi:MAG: GtrA family protein [Myxococcaceae bacterium]|nr:GtrA family protein [Myxococcaceae bacterium]
MSSPPTEPSRPWWRRLERLWAFRSLLVGAGAVLIALVIGWIVLGLGGPTRAAAMLGLAVAWLFTYVANRVYAFGDSDATLASSGIKFVAMAVGTTLVHGQVVTWLTDTIGVPFTVAKLAGDVLVVTIPNLLLMRFVVFPKRAPPG